VRAAGGLDVPVGEAGLTLSTGQARRLALARTLLCQADVVVLDEPTAGLDTEAQAQVLDALERLTAGRTTIVITHAADLASFDRVLSLKDGAWA
jgi:ABC-type transport system involved in cytochrome bd biosynthesis fused ATPase/permease subunit